MEPPQTSTETVTDTSDPKALSPTEHNEDAAFSDADTTTGDTLFFPVSEGKLITLYILSFGLYGVYWFYKNWKLQQPKMDKKISPVWRSIFSIFFTHSLFRRIDQQASHLKTEHRFNANMLATFFVVTLIASNVLDRIFGTPHPADNLTDNFMSNSIIITALVLFVVSVIPLVKAQATVNRINDDMLGYLNHKYSLWNYLLIVLGAIFWILIVLGLLFDFMGLTVPE